ncbi:MAG: hypothetical protein AB1458_08985 [Bacteroidota bacterium]
MNRYDPLRELIQALDKQEKRYVQLSLKKNAAGRKGNYLLLFKALAGQDIDVNDLPLPGKSLAVTRHYLYKTVLRALRNFHYESTIDMWLAERIHEANLLFDKKLFAQCEKLVSRALKVAERHEKKIRMIELMDIELRTLHARVQVDHLKTRAKLYQRKKAALFRQLEELSSLQKISYDNFIRLKTKWVRKGRKPYPIPGRLKERALLSTEAAIQYHQILSAHYFSINDSATAFTHLEKLDHLFDRNPHLVHDHFNQYLALLNNLNLLLFERNDHARIYRNIEKMRAIKGRSVEQRVRIQERLLNVEMNVYKSTGELEKARETAIACQRLLRDKKLGEIYRMLFHLDLFIFYFATEEYKTALNFLNYFLRESRQNIRQDLQKTARLLNMIVHYKLGNFDYFESLIRSAKRFFKKIDRLDALEQLMLSFFSKAVTATDSRQRQALFRELKQAFERLAAIPMMHETYFRNFSFTDWAEAELSNKGFAVIVRQKFLLKSSTKSVK